MTEGSRSGDAGAGGASGRRRRRRRRSKGSGAAGAASSGAAAQTPAAAAGGAKQGGRNGGATARSRRRAGTAGSGGATAGSRTGGGQTRGRSTARKPAARVGTKRTRKPARTKRRPKAPTKREVSAGGVVYRRDGDAIEIVLASRRTRRGQLAWGLAKGGIEDGESMEQAAIREVREETGLKAKIEGSLGETRYFYVWEDVRIRKTVHFFLMRHTGGDIDDRDDEMEEVRWFPLERALKRAAYRGERDVLKRAAELLR